jgi:excisionase family DNA binding protein
MNTNMNKGKPVERIFFTFKEAQEYLSVSRYKLQKLMKSGLPSHRIGKKIVFLKDDVAEWMKEHQG